MQPSLKRSPKRLWRRIAGFLRGVAGFFRRLAHGIVALVKSLPGRLARLGGWLRRNVWGATLGRVVTVLALAAVGMLLLGVLLIFGLLFFHNPEIPRPVAIDHVEYLGQGWDPPSAGAPDRRAFYYTPQGANFKMLRYAWLANLEMPVGRERLAEPDRMRAWGFIVDPGPTPDNPAHLPVGFARYFDEKAGSYVVDLTCALCHTNQLEIIQNGRRVGIRIDGGPAMHAVTDGTFGHFVPTLTASMGATWANPWKFDRFARAVLGSGYPEGRSRLRSELREVTATLVQQGFVQARRHLVPVQEGFGRTDAIGRISNEVFGSHLEPANYRPTNAPVSYPPLWDIWKFDWVQYTGSVRQPMARNLGESLGTGASYRLLDAYGRPVPAGERYQTSSRFEDLVKIESAIQRLKAPKWPEHLLGPIDQDKACRGKGLFAQHCQGCHGPQVADDALRDFDAPLKKATNAPHWIMHLLPVQEVGTDPAAAVNFNDIRVDLRRAGLDPAETRDILRRYLTQDLERKIPYLKRAIAQADKDRKGELEEQLRRAETSGRNDIEAILDRELQLNAVSIGVGLNIFGAYMRERFYRERGFAPEKQLEMDGFGQLDTPQVVLAYKARPLAGAWASAPYLHNGSVPNLYEMLIPADRRTAKFTVKRGIFDPVLVGLSTRPDGNGGFHFNTAIAGNSNLGHEFRAGYVPWKKGAPPQYGVIGPELSEADRFAIIEYLKIHVDGSGGELPRCGCDKDVKQPCTLTSRGPSPAESGAARVAPY